MLMGGGAASDTGAKGTAPAVARVDAVTRPLAVLLALAVLGGAGLGLSPLGEPAGAAPAPRAKAQQEGNEFAVSLTGMSAVIPDNGPVRLRGTVTNTSEETWTALNIHPFTSFSPMTTTRELQVSAESDPELYVGQRIVEAGAFDDSIATLEPGVTARWSIRIPRDVLQISELPGVYWIGVHVLGADPNGLRDGTAHGRARSFIPLLPDDAEPVRTSLVVPVRRPVAHDPEGRLADLEGWATDLASGGRLANLLELASAARESRVTWLVDPAVLDAVAQLAAGNLPLRALEPGEPTGEGEGEDDGDDSDDDSDGDDQVAPATPPPDPEARTLSGPAGAWLRDLTALMQGHRVLALPYGDLDVVAADRTAPDLFGIARDLATSSLAAHGIVAEPAVVPPSGHLTDGALDLVPDDEEVFLAEAAVRVADETGEPVPVVTARGRRVSVHDESVARGGPGPDRRLAPIALRQRILAETAVRSLGGAPRPLQAVLDHHFDPGPNARAFFRELRQPVLRLRSARTPAGPAPEVAELSYPARQEARELAPSHVLAAQELMETGALLDGVLPGTDSVAGAARRQALTTVSYQVRSRPVPADLEARQATTALQEQLGSIGIEAPSFVILSAESGPFAVTITNDLTEPVSLSIRARSDDDVRILAPDPIEVAAGARHTVQLQASARTIGVHSVELVATDAAGTALGSPQVVSIRSNQVGRAIWVVLGVGVGILFLAIPVRWIRRRRQRSAV